MGGIVSSKKAPEKTLPPNARIVSERESTRRRKNEPAVESASKRIKEKKESPPPSIQVDIPPQTVQPPRDPVSRIGSSVKAASPATSLKGFTFPPNTQPKDYFKTVHSAIRWQKPNIAEILDHPDTVDCLDEKTGYSYSIDHITFPNKFFDPHTLCTHTVGLTVLTLSYVLLYREYSHSHCGPKWVHRHRTHLVGQILCHQCCQ